MNFLRVYWKKLPKVNQICANMGICPMGKIHSFVLKTILLYVWIFSYCLAAGKNHSKLNLVNRTGHLLGSRLTSQNNVNEITKLIFNTFWVKNSFVYERLWKCCSQSLQRRMIRLRLLCSVVWSPESLSLCWSQCGQVTSDFHPPPEKSHYSSSQVGQFFFFLSHLLMVLGFWKDCVGKNGVLVSHVRLLDAGIQAWTHLHSDTKYSREGLRLVNGYFLSVHGTKPQGMP